MSHEPERTTRRAAFDIGSGATKLVVADVSGDRVVRVLFGKEIPVHFAIDWKKSEDGTLSDEVRAKGLDVLRELLAVCEAHEVPPADRAAVATEVFRKAANGSAYLEEVGEKLHLYVEVVTQDVEADLGFRTAVALQDGPADKVLCWDSGGASFQITSICPSTGGLRRWVGTWGSGNSTAALVEQVQGRSFKTTPSPNPASEAHATGLMQCMKESFDPPAEWLSGSVVTAIGGPNSMFKVACEALGAESYAVADVKRALASVLGQPDDALAARPFCQGELREPPALIVPKLCLLLAVMEHCGIAEVRFCSSIGSCQGLLISGGRFSAAR